MKRSCWITDDRQNHIANAGKMVEPQPQQPLRWVENCKPDKPGIWAWKSIDGVVSAHYYSTRCSLSAYATGTWCYLGPIPEILPPLKKVVERLFLGHLSSSTKDNVVTSTFIEHWHDDADPNLNPNADHWIRTDRTREREI